MFKYAVSNWIYDDEDLAQTCRRLQQAGCDGIELVGEPDRYDPRRVAALAAEHGLEVVSVLSWCIWPLEDRDLAHADETLRRKAVSYLCRNVDLAVAVGAPVVVVIPAPSGRTAPHGASVEDPGAWQDAASREWTRAVEAVRQIALYAGEKEVNIAVEPINRFETFLVNNTKQGLEFIQEVNLPNVKLHLDTFHMNIEESDVARAVEKAKEHLASMHLSDSNRCAAGRGHFDFQGLFTALSKINFQGPLVLEPLPPHPNPFVANKLPEFQAGWEGDIRESLRYLRGLEKSVRKKSE